MKQHAPARWWSHEGVGVRCELCPHLCLLRDGEIGVCGVRRNTSGSLESLNYGRVSVAAVDNIEKKPIFHFRPGSTLLSVGTIGCNLDCDYCQNSQLARGEPGRVPWTYYSPRAMVEEALEREVDGLAWTFNEPVVWAEYVVDVSKLARESSLYSMVNTNGFISGKARDELFGTIDAIKIDIKSFREGTYRKVCRGGLRPVLETCLKASEAGLHLEIAYPMIPSVNDSAEEMAALFNWVADNLGNETPLHLFRFSPSFRMSHLKQETISRMREARSEAMEAGLRYVYLGGMVSEGEQNTYCPRCGSLVVSRVGKEADEKLYVLKEQMSRFCPSFSGVKVRLDNGNCPRCGEAIRLKFS
jgi:pyruvate formate lyase activating enzyme